MRGESFASEIIRLNKSIARSPALEPATRAGAQCSGKMLISRQQVVSGPCHRLRICIDQGSEQREIIFGFVDGNSGISRRGPAKPAAGGLLGAPHQLIEARQMTL